MPKAQTDRQCCPSLGASPLSDEAATELAQTFAAMADPNRLKVLSLILSAGEVCSCDLIEPLGKSQPTVSHHTSVLAEAGLIEGDRRGRWVYWRVVPGSMESIREVLRPPVGSRSVVLT